MCYVEGNQLNYGKYHKTTQLIAKTFCNLQFLNETMLILNEITNFSCYVHPSYSCILAAHVFSH